MISHRAETMSRSEVDVALLAREALASAVPAALERDITVSFDAPQGPALMRGDAVSLREAFKNVIENAVQHGALSLLRLTVRRAQDGIEVMVSDDGPGIAAELWPHVMQRFFRGPSGSPGSGLGLAIAREVALNHGGDIRFETGNGYFSVIFRFTEMKTS
jgi:two-component system sensor histidine kinase TctE